MPSKKTVSPPEWLDDKALAIWKKHAPDLIRKKVLTAWDVEAFAIYCDAVARHAECAVIVHEEGVTVPQQAGGVKVNPAVTAQMQYADKFKNYGARFGMTPSDRSAITIDAVNEGVTEADELLG